MSEIKNKLKDVVRIKEMEVIRGHVLDGQEGTFTMIGFHVQYKGVDYDWTDYIPEDGSAACFLEYMEIATSDMIETFIAEDKK